MNRKKLLLSSAFLLVLAFPRFELSWLAWGALVPLLFLIENAKNKKAAFGLSWLCGFIFFFFSVFWLRHVSWPGLILLCAYQAVFFGIFGAAVKFFLDAKRRFSFLLFFAIPALWTVTEWGRSEIPVMGFGWNLLAYSQAGNLWVIQTAKVVGAYGVSFLIVFVNAAIFLTLMTGSLAKRIVIGVLGLAVFAANLGFGFLELRKNDAGGSGMLRIGVIQGNIAQDEKWEPGLRDLILEKYLKLTELSSFDDPDLIVWPEAAYPGFFNESPPDSPVSLLLQRLKLPLLFGSPHREAQGVYMNSVYLLSPAAGIVKRYDKIHLVPFGEYVPFKPLLSFLEPYAYALGVSDFSQGREFTVFEMPSEDETRTVRFSVLICFEDVLPDLARRFAEKGAQCLMVVTNDAWFGQSAASYQHLQASVFRAVENAVPVVRAANIGVSCFISCKGKVEDRVRNERGYDTYVTGALIRPVLFPSASTFYQRLGFLFPQACLLGLFLAFLVICTARRRA